MANPSKLPPVPIPFPERLRDFRRRGVPVLVFAAAVAVVVNIWNAHIAPPTMIGQVEGVRADITAPRAGFVREVAAERFQSVRTGDYLAEVITHDPEVLSASLAVIEAEIEVIRNTIDPGIISRQRRDHDHESLRLDMMLQRTAAANARVQLVQAERDYRRAADSLRMGLTSQAAYEAIATERDALRTELGEREAVIADLMATLAGLAMPEPGDEFAADPNPVLAAIRVQEERLRLAEAELRPIRLYAPIDGMLAAVHKQPGQAISPQEPLVTIEAQEGAHIVAYVRQPLREIPAVGTEVEIRRRNQQRELSSARILHVANHFEPISDLLMESLNSPLPLEYGLPVLISLPTGMDLIPGEVIHVRVPIPRLFFSVQE